MKFLRFMYALHRWRRAVHGARCEASRCAIEPLLVLRHSRLEDNAILEQRSRLAYRQEFSRWMAEYHDAAAEDLRRAIFDRILGESAPLQVRPFEPYVLKYGRRGVRVSEGREQPSDSSK